MTKRTTINLPDDLWKEAKIQALELGKDFQELIADRLRHGLGDVGSLQRTLEKIAQPALVSQDTLLKLLEPGREITAAFERTMKKVISDSEKFGLGINAGRDLLQKFEEQTKKRMLEELQRGADRWDQVNSALKAVTDGERPKTTKKKGGRDGR